MTGGEEAGRFRAKMQVTRLSLRLESEELRAREPASRAKERYPRVYLRQIGTTRSEGAL